MVAKDWGIEVAGVSISLLEWVALAVGILVIIVLPVVVLIGWLSYELYGFVTWWRIERPFHRRLLSEPCASIEEMLGQPVDPLACNALSFRSSRDPVTYSLRVEIAGELLEGRIRHNLCDFN